MTGGEGGALALDPDPDDGWYKGKPILRRWELNASATRYDVITSAPSDEQLQKYWWAWAFVALVVGITSLIVFLGIATNKKAMQNPFNLYLLFLAIPDFVFSLSCGITCLLNATNGEYWAAWMCNFQQWYCVFGIGSNAWLNACVTRELYTMLKFSDKRRRYKSPSRRFVSQQALAVYLYMAFLGTWGIMEAPHWPFHSGASGGLACLPIEVDQQSSLFFWLAFFPLFAGIPSIYIVFVTYQVWRRKLLPPTGKRRLLTVYFGRLVVVFYVMWLPTLVILFAFSSFVPPWVHFVGGLWSHLQGAVSAGVSVLKPDIYAAVMAFLTCRSCRDCKPAGGSDEEEETLCRSCFNCCCFHRDHKQQVAITPKNETLELTSTDKNHSNTNPAMPGDSAQENSSGDVERTQQNKTRTNGASQRWPGERYGSSSVFLSNEIWPSSSLRSMRNSLQSAAASLASSQFLRSSSMALEDLAEGDVEQHQGTADPKTTEEETA